MTSQRDEAVGRTRADDEMADEPIIVERHDEILTEGGMAGDPADGLAGDGTPEDGATLEDDPAAGHTATDSRAADSTLDGTVVDGPPEPAAGPSDELADRDAVPDTGGVDPAPLVVPAPSAPVEDSRTDDPSGPAGAGAAGIADLSDVPGASVASPPAASSATADTGAGLPAAALSEQQWPAIQAMFVDDPKGSVQRAAGAADEVVKALVASIEREQAALREAWQNDASTEDLRTALQQYRAFCGRLEGLA